MCIVDDLKRFQSAEAQQQDEATWLMTIWVNTAAAEYDQTSKTIKPLIKTELSKAQKEDPVVDKVLENKNLGQKPSDQDMRNYSPRLKALIREWD